LFVAGKILSIIRIINIMGFQEILAALRRFDIATMSQKTEGFPEGSRFPWAKRKIPVVDDLPMGYPY